MAQLFARELILAITPCAEIVVWLRETSLLRGLLQRSHNTKCPIKYISTLPKYLPCIFPSAGPIIISYVKVEARTPRYITLNAKRVDPSSYNLEARSNVDMVSDILRGK